MSERAQQILQAIARQRPALEAMKHVSLVLPMELDTVGAVLAALDEAAAAGLLDDAVVLPEGANPMEEVAKTQWSELLQ